MVTNVHTTDRIQMIFFLLLFIIYLKCFNIVRNNEKKNLDDRNHPLVTLPDID